jgi:peptidoglycan-N-acetylglucosamine deacetylase
MEASLKERPPLIITTSWDDGAEDLDMKMADLLAKYGLKGTFYVPRSGPYPVLSDSHIRELMQHFEIGAHTLSHQHLTTCSISQAREEISGSKKWLEQVLGRECYMFSPPGGRQRFAHLDLAANAGFHGCRTVEMLSFDLPRRDRSGLLVMPTTLIAVTGNSWGVLKNLIKRRKFERLPRWSAVACTMNLESAATVLVNEVSRQRHGVFHFWGHTWEIERLGLWNKVEDVFRLLRENLVHGQAMSNGEICDHVETIS